MKGFDNSSAEVGDLRTELRPRRAGFEISTRECRAARAITPVTPSRRARRVRHRCFGSHLELRRGGDYSTRKCVSGSKVTTYKRRGSVDTVWDQRRGAATGDVIISMLMA